MLLVVHSHGRRPLARRSTRCLCAIALLGLTSPWGCSTEPAIISGNGSPSSQQDGSDPQQDAQDDNGQDSPTDVLGLNLDNDVDGSDTDDPTAINDDPTEVSNEGNAAPIANAG